MPQDFNAAGRLKVAASSSLPFLEWKCVLEAKKTIFGWPDWQTPAVFREPKQAALRAGRLPFVSHEAERCRLHVQVMNETGATLEGVEVLLMMWRNRPLEDMTALLNVSHEGKYVCISRVDVRPDLPHANRHWRRIGCPPHIDGSHVHPFEQNMALGPIAFDPLGNLPVAYPLSDEPEHLRDFLQVVELAFNVDGLTSLPPPPTQGRLL